MCSFYLFFSWIFSKISCSESIVVNPIAKSNSNKSFGDFKTKREEIISEMRNTIKGQKLADINFREARQKCQGHALEILMAEYCEAVEARCVRLCELRKSLLVYVAHPF